jgi:MFS family permease
VRTPSIALNTPPLLNHEQSIVFRALQGIGGSGIYSLAMASILEITPLKYVGHTSAAVAISNACASILGPIVGGAITSGTTWRWVFWLKYASHPPLDCPFAD